MSWASTSRFSVKNLRTVGRSLSNCCTASASSWSVLVKLFVNCARFWFSATNCLSFWCSALTNSARLCNTAKRSPRPSFTAVKAAERLFSVVLICLPLPASPSAKESIRSPNGPLGCSLVGPSLSMMLAVSLRSWSHSTGTRVRSIGITALSARTGPPS